MKKYLSVVSLLILAAIGKHSSAQTGKPVTDYFRIATPMVFDQQSYNLVWTSHLASNFYKQEYLQKGDVLEKFRQMILIDVVTGEQDIKAIVKAKVDQLKLIRETNPLVNYEILEHKVKGEYMLDFMIGQQAQNGTMQIVERNVYRYKMVTDKSGRKGVLLFGVSTRSYGKEIDGYLQGLKSTRKKLIESVSNFNIPEVVIGE